MSKHRRDGEDLGWDRRSRRECSALKLPGLGRRLEEPLIKAWKGRSGRLAGPGAPAGSDSVFALAPSPPGVISRAGGGVGAAPCAPGNERAGAESREGGDGRDTSTGVAQRERPGNGVWPRDLARPELPPERPAPGRGGLFWSRGRNPSVPGVEL